MATFKTNLRVGDIVMFEWFSGVRVGPYRIREFCVEPDDQLFAHIFPMISTISGAHAWVLANRLSPVET